MTAELILDPASAVAVGRCLLARLRGTPLHIAATNDHPRVCAWEDYSRADLAQMLEDFNHEVGWDDRWQRFRHVDAERFHALPKPEQARRIAAAQYPSEATA